MQQQCTLSPGDLKEQENDDDFFDDPDFDSADEHQDLIEFPVDGSMVEIVFWVLLFPLRLLMHFTLPDVRKLDEKGEPTATIGKSFLSTFMCLVWLIVASYCMVASLEALAALMNIPDAVIGFTVSAAGKQDSTSNQKTPSRCWEKSDLNPSTSRFFLFRRYFSSELRCLKGSC